MITLGILIGNLIVLGTESINSTASWKIPQGISFVWAIILAGGIFLFPETPKFDFLRGRKAAARETMSRFYGVAPDHPVITEQIDEMETKAAAESRAIKMPLSTIFTGPSMLYRTLLGAALQAFQQLTGANYFFFYGNTVFESTGLDNSYVTQVILGAVNLACTCFGLWLVSHVTRRKCLVYGALWMFVCFMIFASLGKFKLTRADGTNDPAIGKVMIVFSCLFIAAFASTWGPLVW
jgi:MFS transporter, SP family, sugar:H+ symporter